jgi:hypothetical protein
MTAEARQHNPIDINKQRMLSTQNLIQEDGSQAEGHTQTLNLDDWIITCKNTNLVGASDLINKIIE